MSDRFLGFMLLLVYPRVRVRVRKRVPSFSSSENRVKEGKRFQEGKAIMAQKNDVKQAKNVTNDVQSEFFKFSARLGDPSYFFDGWRDHQF